MPLFCSRSALAVLPLCGLLLGCVSTLHHGRYERVQVRGSQAFVNETLAALRALDERAPLAFRLVEAHISWIYEDDETRLPVGSSPARYNVDSRIAAGSPTWYASSIAHDAYHAKLYRDYANVYEGRVPSDAWIGRASEKAALSYQISVLVDLGAPAGEIRSLEALESPRVGLGGHPVSGAPRTFERAR